MQSVKDGRETLINANSRFAVAIHVLTILASRTEELITSEEISTSVITNPVVIRRVLGELRKAELVESHSGNRGGWRLKRAPEKITLKETYAAVREGLPFGLPMREPNPKCDIGAKMSHVVTTLFEESETSLCEYFSSITIADVLTRVKLTDCKKIHALESQ